MPRSESSQRRISDALHWFDERFFTFAVILSLSVAIIATVLWWERAVHNWNVRDSERRAAIVAQALEEDVRTLPPLRLEDRLELLSTDARILGVLACRGSQTVRSRAVPEVLGCGGSLHRRAVAIAPEILEVEIGGVDLGISAHRVGDAATLVIVQDRGFVWSRRQTLLRRGAIGGVTMLVLVGLLVYAGARLLRRRVRLRISDLIKLVATGERDHRELPREISDAVRALNQRVQEARSRIEPKSTGAGRLRTLIGELLPDSSLVVIANREPYTHSRDEGGSVRVERPASGLVTGVEPLLKACGGVWIGHGSGNADRETADEKGRLGVPPENPEYVLRRIWLTRAEEEGYYLGFANEGLWPLCHIAHARPTFRTGDWEQYQKVNRRFAAAAAEEAGDAGLVLVQDYHYATLPLELRKLKPDATISLFWHIPWPNHEVVAICPWRIEILEGMLGADVIGFHTRYHSLNFLETVQRYLECRVDLETMSVEYQGRKTLVRQYPISIDWPVPPLDVSVRHELRQLLGIDDDVHVAVSVDRADYTKGLIEKIEAVEKLVEMHPELAGRFTLLQLAAPSRTKIKRYRDLVSDLEESANRVNRRFPADPPPVILQIRSHSPEEVRKFYRMADSAIVTPLHDGMNLVAKEFVANCGEDGVLVLSQFAGAAKELESALIVNPYDAVDVANAIQNAIAMPDEEKRIRLKAMRSALDRNTIYDWSGRMLTDLAALWRERHHGWQARINES